MPRHGRTTQKPNLVLAGLFKHSRKQSRHHPHHSHRPSKSNSRRNNGSHGVWNTLVQPISILDWLIIRRSLGYCRRGRRSQGCGVRSIVSRNRKNVGNQSHMPCGCVIESPTPEEQMVKNYGKPQQQKLQQQKPQQSLENNNTNPTAGTTILHQNPLFNVENKTCSSLILKHNQKSQMYKSKSRWNVRGDKSQNKHFLNGAVPQDAAKKKSKTRVPTKKGIYSGSDTSAESMNASNSRTTIESGASSDKTKSETVESNYFEEIIDSAMPDDIGVNMDYSTPRNILDESIASTLLLDAMNENSTIMAQ